MNKLLALCYFVLSLYGCDVGGSTFVTRSHADGVDTLYSRVVAQSGVARFECLRSASGRCHYTVFAPACASPPAATGRRDGRCRSTPVERFAIAQGDSRQIAGLLRFRPCVSTQANAPGPDCELPAPIAAR